MTWRVYESNASLCRLDHRPMYLLIPDSCLVGRKGHQSVLPVRLGNNQYSQRPRVCRFLAWFFPQCRQFPRTLFQAARQSFLSGKSCECLCQLARGPVLIFVFLLAHTLPLQGTQTLLNHLEANLPERL